MANKKEKNIEKKERSIDEIAREAMDAIKKSEIDEERRYEREAQEELKAKEEALKNEVKQKLKRKLRRLEKEEEEEEKKKKINEVDTSFMVTWTNKDKSGFQYIGEYNEKLVFKISRGMNLFHLKILGEDIHYDEWRKNSHTSINLSTLKIKADKILKESNKIQEIIDKKEKKE